MNGFKIAKNIMLGASLFVQGALMYGAHIQDKLFTAIHWGENEDFAKSFNSLSDAQKTNALQGRNESGQTLLIAAINKELVPAVDILLAAGADVNTQTPSMGWSPLMYAAAKGNIEIVMKLLDSDRVNFDLKSNVVKKTAQELALERRNKARDEQDKQKEERYALIIEAINQAKDAHKSPSASMIKSTTIEQKKDQ